MLDGKKLISDYANWLKQSMKSYSVDDHTLIIDSPFLDRHNDFIQIFVQQISEDKLELSDDGYTLSDLSASGFEINSPQRKRYFDSILNGYGVSFDEKTGIVFTEASMRTFASKKHALVQAVLSMNDMFMLNRSSVRGLFAEDVADYLDSIDVRFSRNLSVTGKSGLAHRYEIIIPPSKKDVERFIKPLNQLSKSQTESILFAWDETRKVRDDAKLIVMINDAEGSAPQKNIEALKEYDIVPIPYSDRDEYKSQFVA